MIGRWGIRDASPGIFVPCFEPYCYNTIPPWPPRGQLHPAVKQADDGLYVYAQGRTGADEPPLLGPYDAIWGLGEYQRKTIAHARRGDQHYLIFGTDEYQAGEAMDGPPGIVHGQPCFRTKIDGLWHLGWGECIWAIQGEMVVGSLHIFPSVDGQLADITYLTIDQRKMSVVWNEEPGHQFDDIQHFSVDNGRVRYVGRNLGFWYIVQDNIVSKPFDGLLHYEVINGHLLAVGCRRETSIDTSWYVLTGNAESDRRPYRGVFNLAIDRTAGIVRFDESVTERGNHQRQITLR